MPTENVSNIIIVKFLTNVVFSVIKRKSSSKLNLHSLLKFISIFSNLTSLGTCSQNNNFILSKRTEISRILREISSSIMRHHPSIQVAKSVKHGFGVSTFKFGPVIEAGEILLEESPLIVFDDNASTSNEVSRGMQYAKRLQDELIDNRNCKDDVISRLVTLAPYQESPKICSFLLEDQVRKHEVLEILTNIVDSNMMKMSNVDFAISSSEDDDSTRALYFFASRFNHSCNPNAILTFRHKKIQNDTFENNYVRVVALRKILPGEEIFISYCNPVDSRKNKIDRMGFACCVVDRKNTNEPTFCCKICSVVDPENNGDKSTTSTSERDVNSLLERVLQFQGEGKPVSAFRYLLGYLKTPQFNNLPKLHHLRFRLYQETLACAVGGSVTCLKDIDELLSIVAVPLVEASEVLFPQHWPLMSGFKVHLAYLFALRARILQMEEKNHNQDEEDEEEASGSIGEYWERKDQENHRKAMRLVEEAKSSHELIFGHKTTSMKSFEERFEVELDCMM